MLKFIQDKGYLSKGDFKLYSIEKLQDDITYNVLLIDSESSLHEKIIAISNLLAEVTQAVSLTKLEYNSTVNKEGVDLELVHMLRTLSPFIGFLVGCSSFRGKKLEDYDKLELNKRLELLKTFFKT